MWFAEWPHIFVISNFLSLSIKNETLFFFFFAWTRMPHRFPEDEPSGEGWPYGRMEELFLGGGLQTLRSSLLQLKFCGGKVILLFGIIAGGYYSLSFDQSPIKILSFSSEFCHRFDSCAFSCCFHVLNVS